MKNKITLIILILTFSSLAYSFDWSKCKYTAGAGAGAGIFLSTTSFISSTGRCSMIGKIPHDKKVFFASNFESIRVDVAKGQGEFLANYLSISKCSPDAQSSIMSTLQSQYASIYQPGPQNDPKSSFWALEKILREAGQGQCIIST